MPQTLLAAMEILQSSGEPEIADVVTLVEHDPAVVARVLRIANSAYYGQRAEIGSARRAVVVLGPGTVLGLVMSMGVAELQDAFDDQTMAPFLNIVRHSVATAFIAQEIARGERGEDDSPSEAFTAGLLHDLGKLVLLYNHPKSAADLYRTVLPDTLLLEEEEKLFGTNHIRMGVAVSARLRLPERLQEAISYHHAIDGRTPGILVQYVRTANELAYYLGFPENSERPMTLHEAAALTQATLDAWQARRDDVERYVESIL